YAATSAIVIALDCAFIRAFDLPVFWPILLITMKRQIKHTIKYRYTPFDIGKNRYAGGGETPVKSSI
ncbi:hypothetical protein HK096_008464, partial [Nowakowskiella sp. JEL0078]